MHSNDPTDAATDPDRVADALRSDAPIVLFWRPGCGFCSSLERGLQRTGVPYERVNIWEERDAAAFVRSVANGNEVVPTIRIGSVALVNPSATEVLRTARVEVPAAVAGIAD